MWLFGDHPPDTSISSAPLCDSLCKHELSLLFVQAEDAIGQMRVGRWHRGQRVWENPTLGFKLFLSMRVDHVHVHCHCIGVNAVSLALRTRIRLKDHTVYLCGQPDYAQLPDAKDIVIVCSQKNE